MFVWEKIKLHSYCLTVGGGEQSKCWRGCMCVQSAVSFSGCGTRHYHMCDIFYNLFYFFKIQFKMIWASGSLHQQYSAPSNTHILHVTEKKGFKTWMSIWQRRTWIPSSFWKYFEPSGSGEKRKDVCLEALINSVYLDGKGWTSWSSWNGVSLSL